MLSPLHWKRERLKRMLQAGIPEEIECEEVNPNESKASKASKASNAPSNYDYEASEISMMQTKYQSIMEDSSYLLNHAVYLDTVNNTMQITIVILGLIAGFVSAISGIDAVVKTYIGSVFSLLTSMIAGVMSIKKFGVNSGRYYAAYQEYKELATYLNNLLLSLRADQKFQDLNLSIAGIEAKYEIMFPKNKVSLEKVLVACNTLKELTEQSMVKRDQDRDAKLKNDLAAKKLARARLFLDRKAFIYLHEIKLQLYKRYVETAHARDSKEVILDFENYENYFRVKHVEQFQVITDTYNDYQRRQLQAYRLATDGETFNYAKIDEELNSVPLFRMPEKLFYQKVLHRFHEHLKTIKEKTGTDTDIYSFDNLI